MGLAVLSARRRVACLYWCMAQHKVTRPIHYNSIFMTAGGHMDFWIGFGFGAATMLVAIIAWWTYYVEKDEK